MVFFTCTACGQSVKKNQVEKHYTFQCKNCQSLTCMDCNKEFWGDEYKAHTKCITEDQKYGGKDYVVKPNANKGEIKQEKWIEHIKSTISSKKLSGPLADLLNQVIEYPNIPRKQSKFKNFLENSLRMHNPRLISEAWEIFAQSTKNDPSDTPKANSLTNGGQAKRPLNSNNETPNKKVCVGSSESFKQNGDAFDWCRVCEKILQNHPSGLSEKQLRKQALAEYRSLSGESCSLSKTELKKQLRDILSNNSIFTLHVNKSKESVS